MHAWFNSVSFSRYIKISRIEARTRTGPLFATAVASTVDWLVLLFRMTPPNRPSCFAARAQYDRAAARYPPGCAAVP